MDRIMAAMNMNGFGSSSSSSSQVSPAPNHHNNHLARFHQEELPMPPTSKSSNVLDLGHARDVHLAELHALHELIVHKQHCLSVYINASEHVEARPNGERCLVFLADNLFVSTQREKALEMLGRQIQVFQASLKMLEEEKKALEERVQLMERLNITSEGLVEIREPADDDAKAQKPGRRIAHSPKLESKRRKIDGAKNVEEKSPAKGGKRDDQIPKRPEGISEQDYQKFVELVSMLELSASDEDERRQEEEEEMEEPDGDEATTEGADDTASSESWKEMAAKIQPNMDWSKYEALEAEEEEAEEVDGDENGGVQGGGGRRVHFSKRFNTSKPMGTFGEKSILKNRNEHSPIDEEELQRMEKREQKQLVPVSKETLGDEVVERNLNRLVPGPKMTLRSDQETNNSNGNVPKSQMRAQPNKRQIRKNRPVSRWKAQRMGLPLDDDDVEEGPEDGTSTV